MQLVLSTFYTLSCKTALTNQRNDAIMGFPTSAKTIDIYFCCRGNSHSTTVTQTPRSAVGTIPFVAFCASIFQDILIVTSGHASCKTHLVWAFKPKYCNSADSFPSNHKSCPQLRFVQEFLPEL